ncbi:TetR/AcrR family transcriptional regulator C-terminal domain-containing protein [Subtercola sp. YIM 133946]|uniref:TetR/AcrR family transcriptional regulator C-terminal domain-containing protein n=1 Tax=Subtercola sp. YIM 133946 TaxID=3118909 RepID=UPI002F931203
MTKVNKQQVVDEALALLDEVGLDGFSTRRLAQRLGVEQPTLYWHFKRKEDLLTAMAEAALEPLGAIALPSPGDDWQQWFIENYRSFRRILLQHRDGARLHAGTFPNAEGFDRLSRKFAFLAESGLPEQDARLAMLTASRFTIGSTLEEQSHPGAEVPDDAPAIDHDKAFEEGLRLLVDGLNRRH